MNDFFFAIPRLERLAFLLFFNSHQSLLGFFDSFFYSKESNISSVSPFIDSETVLFFYIRKKMRIFKDDRNSLILFLIPSRDQNGDLVFHQFSLFL